MLKRCITAVALITMLLYVFAALNVSYAGKPGTSSDTKNILAADNSSTPVIIGEVVGSDSTNRVVDILLDPTLVNQESTSLVRANGSRIFGSDYYLYFSAASCSGTAYFEESAGANTITPIFVPTFVEMITATSFKVYKHPVGTVPVSVPVASRMYSIPGQQQSCEAYQPGTTLGVPADQTTHTLILSPPFKVVNP